MKITFYGATKTVTGSMFLIERNGKRILVECGLFQGRRKEAERINKEFPFDPKSIDLLLLSHAHIDHSGNIPNLVKQGYKNPIVSTYATLDLLDNLLKDSGHIHEKDVEYINKKNKRKNLPPIEPLYTVKDAEKSMQYFKGVNYYNRFEIDKDFSATFVDAGHILGSSQILLEFGKKTLLFTGDLGRDHLPIIRNPDIIENVDAYITESTYGNTLHRKIAESQEELKNVILRTVDRKGKVIVPAFSVGRTQEVIFDLFNLRQEGAIPQISIYVDSPLSSAVTKIFKEHPECYDKEMMMLLNSNLSPFEFNGLKYISSVEESKALNDIAGSAVIISASGMCEAGRILHHLKNSIEDKRNTVLITGFMAADTLGRRIVEKQQKIKIFSEEYSLNAEVVRMNEYSAHADRNDLISHTKKANPGRIFILHGEEMQQLSFKGALNELGYNDIAIPSRGDSFVIEE